MKFLIGVCGLATPCALAVVTGPCPRTGFGGGRLPPYAPLGALDLLCAPLLGALEGETLSHRRPDH